MLRESVKRTRGTYCTHTHTLWWCQDFSSLMINSWDAIRQPVTGAWSLCVCGVCLCSLSWGVIASVAAPGASSCKSTAKERASKERSCGSNWPEWMSRDTYVIRGTQSAAEAGEAAKQRQKHRHLEQSSCIDTNDNFSTSKILLPYTWIKKN